MTDKPTVALLPAQWRDLVLGNLARVHSFVSQRETLTPEEQTACKQALDQAIEFATAWRLSMTPPAQPEVTDAQHTNGAAAPKRGGWPKGRPRKSRESAVMVG